MDDISIVIVTCIKDLALFERSIKSIAQYGVISPSIKIIIIANDDISLVDKLVELTNPLSLNVDILHYSAVDEWTGHIGWDSQQYFKLSVANLITTPWYLIMDSDNYVVNPVSTDHLFVDSRAFCSWVVPADHHVKHLQRAHMTWNNQDISLEYSMGDSPPFLMHTSTTKNLLPHIDKEWFNYNNPGPLYTFEFFLYYAYLEHINMFDTLYIKNNTSPMRQRIKNPTTIPLNIT